MAGERENFQKKMGVFLIKAFALFLIVRGSWMLVKDLRPVIFTFCLFPERLEQWGASALALIFFNALFVPLLFIAGGAGMLALRQWGRHFVFFGLWFSVLFQLTGIVCKWYFQVALRTTTFVVRQGYDPVLNIAISSYIFTLIEVAIIIFLMRVHVRQQFRE